MLILFQSCVFIRVDDSIDLGNHYRFIQDSPQTIIYYKTPKYKGVGLEIVPPFVIDYSYNENWIIARNRDLDGKIKYWIIDKHNHQEVISPLDSLSFYKTLDDKSIMLRLKKQQPLTRTV
jgi:hypothetical protein